MSETCGTCKYMQRGRATLTFGWCGGHDRVTHEDKTCEDWAYKPEPPRWTSTPPTEEGWYWGLPRGGAAYCGQLQPYGWFGIHKAELLAKNGHKWWPVKQSPPPIPKPEEKT